MNQNRPSGNDSFGSDADYDIAVFGTAVHHRPVLVQLGGHHLARNYTYK